MQEYAQEIGRVLAPDLPGCDCGQLMTAPAQSCLRRDINFGAWHYFVIALKKVLCKNEWLVLHRTPGARLLFVMETARADHLRAFEKVVGTAPGSDTLCVEQRHRAWRTTGGMCRCAVQAVRWMHRARRTRLSRLEAWMCLPYFQLAVDAAADLAAVDFSAYRMVTVFLDIWHSSAMAVQRCRALGVPTATLQHGIYSAFEGHIWALERSDADLFLAWNRFTVQQAAALGCDTARFRVLGIPKYIGVPPLPAQTQSTGCFGVVMNGFPYREDRAMLRAANALCAQTGMRYYVRYHPLQPADQYAADIAPGALAGDLTGTPLAEYADRVDFSLVGCSTVFTELVYLNRRAYHYVDAREPNIYAALRAGAFSTPADVLQNESQKESVRQELFDELCTVQDIEGSYRAFYADVCKEKA